MQIKEVDLEKTEIFSIGRQYSNNVLAVHFVNLPNLNNKYIYYKIDDIEQEIPLVSDLFIVSRPLTMHSGKVKAQIITRDDNNSTIELTKNFTMIIEASNYSGIGEDEKYPDDPNIKNYYVKIDGKIQSMDELIALVQSKLDNGEFIGAKGPKGEKGAPGEKGDPGDVTEEYRNLASQIEQNASDAQTSATNAQTSASNAQKSFNDAKTFANQTKTELNQIKTDTNTLKDEANTSALNAKASEDKAKEYADNLQASTNDISKLKEDLYNKINKFYASNQGETHITDSDNGKIQDMMIYGKSLQDGTPTPNNPIEIQSVVNPKLNASNGDGTLTQEATLPYTLNAIPVSSGGNVTIDGQEYIADYVDIENKKLVRNVRKMTLTSLSSLPVKVKGTNGEYHYSFGYKMLDASKTLFNLMNGAWVYLMCENTRIVPQSSELKYNENVMSAYGHKDGFEIRLRPLVDDYPTLEELNAYLTSTVVIYPIEPTITDLTDEEVEAFKELATYYPVTNISVNSEQLDGYTVFNYPISLANGWNYVKQQLSDNRDYIYDMDLQSAEAYVNSEYAVTLTELEV